MKISKFIKSNVMFVMSLLATLVCALLGDASVLLATAVAPPTSASDVKGAGSASEGQQGLNTQMNGQATTVSNVGDATIDLIQPDIDSVITQIASDESVLDNIKRRAKRQIQVSSWTVDHYMIDEKKASVLTTSQSSAASQVSLNIDASDYGLFQKYYTLIAKGVDGYDADGVTKQGDLMLYVVGIDDASGKPIVKAPNGPRTSASADTTVPIIPTNTELILLSSACYETQTRIAPSTIVPIPETLYLQKQVCNSIVSDYFDAQKKRIPFQKAQIAEAAVRQFRLENCRTAWVGQKAKMKVSAEDKTLGVQDVYFSKGIRWQIKREFNLDTKITFNDIIDLAMIKFTGMNCSKNALFLLGKDLMADIQKIDITLHKDITMMQSEVYGIKCTKLHTVFGDINLVYDPMLDRLGYSTCGALLDEEGLVRYWMKNESQSEEKVEGEEAKRSIVMNIDCLCLKGYSHVWVNGPAVSEYSNAIKIVRSATFPTDAKKGDVVILTAATTSPVTAKAGDIYQFTGVQWVVYDGGLALA